MVWLRNMVGILLRLHLLKMATHEVEAPWAQNVTVMQVASGGIGTLPFRQKEGRRLTNRQMDREYLPLETCYSAPLPRDYNRSHSRC
jgi:hypothetical protein